MPAIPIFNAPYPSISVGDGGETAFREQAREIGALGREGQRVLQAGASELDSGFKAMSEKLVQNQDYQDRITGVRTLSELKLNNQKELNDLIAGTTPDQLPQALAQHQAQFDDRLGQWQTQFADSSKHTQLWAEEQASTYKLEQSKRLASDSAVNAGNKAVFDIGHTANNIAGTLSNNPSTLELDSALHTWDQATQAALLNPALTNLPERAKIQHDLEAQRGQFVETGIYKMLDANPNAPQLATQLTQKYGEFLTPQQQRAIAEHGQTAGRQQFWQDRAVVQDKERAEKRDADAALRDLTRSTFSVGPDGNPNGERFVPPDYFSKAMTLSRMPGASETVLREAVRDAQEIWNRTKNGVIATTDPTTYRDLFGKAYNGLTDKDIFTAHANGKLSDHDSTMLHQAVADADRNPQKTEQKRQFDQFVNTFAKGLILKSNIMNPSAWEAERLQQFENDKWQQFQTAIGSGAKPFDLLDQRNPAFIGKDIERYQLTGQQQMQAIRDKATGGLKPLPPVSIGEHQPGESQEDYIKRVRGQR